MGEVKTADTLPSISRIDGDQRKERSNVGSIDWR